LYKFADINWAYRDKKYNGKIGTLDLETLTVNNGAVPLKRQQMLVQLVNNQYMQEVGL
jgi:hypothetical protein